MRKQDAAKRCGNAHRVVGLFNSFHFLTTKNVSVSMGGNVKKVFISPAQ